VGKKILKKLLRITDGAMSSSGLRTINFQNMTNDNKQQKLSDSTKPAIAYSTCYVSGFILIFSGGFLL
jgi:hypothetical protein